MARDKPETQSKTSDVWVGVRSDGIHKESGTPVASEFIIEASNPDHHVHIGLDESGNEIFHTER